jgi:DNA-binding response OmpR family regulator
MRSVEALDEEIQPQVDFADSFESSRTHDSRVVKGDFSLDMRLRSAVVRGKKLELGQKEFDLLHFVLSHPKQLVTPHTALRIADGNGHIRQCAFMNTLLSLSKKLDMMFPGSHYLRIEPLAIYRFNP